MNGDKNGSYDKLAKRRKKMPIHRRTREVILGRFNSISEFVRENPVLTGGIGAGVLATLGTLGGIAVVRRRKRKASTKKRKKTTRRMVKRRITHKRRRHKKGVSHRSPRHRGHKRVSFTTKGGKRVSFLVKPRRRR